MLTRRNLIQAGIASALVPASARARHARGGAAANAPWTPAYYQNFDTYSPGTSGILNTYGITAVDASQYYSSPNSARIDIANGSTAPGGAAEALVANINPAAGNEVWFRVRTYFPTGFNFSATPHLKFLRIETDPTSSHAPSHIDCYITGGNASAVGYFDFIYEGQATWMYGGGSTTPLPTGIVRGQWQTWEVYYYLSSSTTTAIWRMWRDGTLIMDTTRAIPSAGAALYNLSSGFNIPYNGAFGGAEVGGFMHVTYWNGGAAQAQSWYIDDFTIATDLVSVPTAQDSYGNYYIGMTNPS